MSYQIQNQNGSTWKVVTKIGILVLAIAVLGLCLCGILMTLTPLLAPYSWTDVETGQPYTPGQGLLTSSICCFVPAFLLIATGLGIWFLFIRS